MSYGSYGPSLGAKVIGVVVAIVLLLGVILGIMSSTTVDARSVGIQTQFGKYVDTLPAGHHWTNPFSSVEQFSTQIQPLDKDIKVAFDGGSSGTAGVTVRWSIDAEGAEELWKDWKTFDRVRDNLVASETREATGVAFSAFTPENAIDGANRAAIQADIVKTLTTRLGSRGVHIDSVSITGVALDASAQKALDRIVEANANVERAKAEQEKAKIEAETARIRQSSQTPEALQRYCLEVVNSWNVGNNGPLPATFDCSLGASGTPVIVGTK